MIAITIAELAVNLILQNATCSLSIFHSSIHLALILLQIFLSLNCLSYA